MTNIQYIEQAKKGLTVSYGQGSYRIQDDGRGWLHIVVKKKKVDLKKVLLFEYGTFPDWIFNGWYKIYTDYFTFKSFAETERLAV